MARQRRDVIGLSDQSGMRTDARAFTAVSRGINLQKHLKILIRLTLA